MGHPGMADRESRWGVPPSPPRILVFMELRTFSCANGERVGVTRKILWNKDLADVISA